MILRSHDFVKIPQLNVNKEFVYQIFILSDSVPLIFLD